MNGHLPTSRATASAAVAKPSGRRRHKHAPGDEDLCKYASKACYNRRVTKKTGELHRYCEHHRVQASHNQRRLEQRRRLQGQGECKPVRESDARSPTSSTYSVISDSSSNGSYSDASHEETASVRSDTFEPFRHPVPLHAEDLSSLRYVFDDVAAHARREANKDAVYQF